MFGIVLKAQQKVLNSLKDWDKKLEQIRENIEKTGESRDEKSVIYPLAQARMYDNLRELTDADLAEINGISRQKLKKVVNVLKEKGYLIQTKQKPSMHEITDELWDQIKYIEEIN